MSNFETVISSVKSALTDICRELGVDFQLVKLFTSIIDDDTAEGDFTDLVKCFIREHKLKDFFITRPEFQIYFEAIIGMHQRPLFF